MLLPNIKNENEKVKRKLKHVVTKEGVGIALILKFFHMMWKKVESYKNLILVEKDAKLRRKCDCDLFRSTNVAQAQSYGVPPLNST